MWLLLPLRIFGRAGRKTASSGAVETAQETSFLLSIGWGLSRRRIA
jgi:hypothetical protein